MIELRHDEEIDAVVFVVNGTSGLNEYRDAIDDLLKQPYFHENVNTIWDLRQLDASTLDGEQIRLSASYSKHTAHLRGTHWKTAIVAPGDLSFGLSRMFAIFIDDAPFEIEIFRTMEEARKWVKPGS